MIQASIWPRRQRRGERLCPASGRPACKRLQFGHDVSVVENPSSVSGVCGIVLLQFGHDVSVVENVAGACVLRNSILALQFGHDVSVVENVSASTSRVQPGVASIWPRRQRRGEPDPLGKGQKGNHRGFNLATTSASWRTPPRATAGNEISGLQFGHDVSVVENSTRPPSGIRPGGASIWPRRQRRGEPASHKTASANHSRLQFGHDVSVVENNAAKAADTLEAMLQFGHDVSVVENKALRASRPTSAGLQFGHDVSVVENLRHGPAVGVSERLQFGHDVSVVENPYRRPAGRDSPASFNLATTSASWRTCARSPYTAPRVPLQFGHDVSVVENAACSPIPGRSGRASIWPRRQRRGERGATPRSPTRRSGFNLATTSASWRTYPPVRARSQDMGLQFGHDVSVVENRAGRRRWR